MGKCIDKILSKCHFGLRKGDSAPYALLVKTEKTRRSCNEKGTAVVLFTSLSKAFD